jgi:hypothetical protein
MFGHVPPLAAGFAGDRLSPDLPVLQQVEQSPRAEQAEEKGGTTKNIGAILNGCAMLVQLAPEDTVHDEKTAIEIGRAECRKG